mmetsp:Transcript_95330/g.199402  ORF Transcript_95330/g.199402 Transcript_95330/m.199402 type:complete len:865 (+) Transcript_95330:181-2775(+)
MPCHVRLAPLALLSALLSRVWSLEVSVARHQPEAVSADSTISDDELGSFFATDEAPRGSLPTAVAPAFADSSKAAQGTDAASLVQTASVTPAPTTTDSTASAAADDASRWQLSAAQVSSHAGKASESTGKKARNSEEESEADRFLESDTEDEHRYGQDDDASFDGSSQSSKTEGQGMNPDESAAVEEDGEDFLAAEDVDIDFVAESQGVAGLLASEAKEKAEDAALDRAARGEELLDDQEMKIDANAPKEVTTVLKALQDVKKQMSKEGVVEAQNYKKVKDWCSKEVNTQKKAKTVANTTKVLNRDNAKDQRAEISILEHRLKVISATLQEVGDVMEQATAVRKKEANKYESDLAMNKQSILDVGKARKLLASPASKDTSFVQSVLKGKLNTNIRGANRLPSNYILGMLTGLQQDMEKTQAELIKEEKDKQDKYDKLMATKTASRESLEEEQSDKTDRLTAAKVKLLEFEKVITIATEQEAKAKKMLQETTAHCSKAAKDYEEASKTRQEESAALAQAMEIIKAGNTQYGFVAVRNASSANSEAEEEDAHAQDDVSLTEEVKDELAGMEAETYDVAPSFLEVAATLKSSSTSASKAADHADAEGDAAGEVVQTLIQQLQATQVEQEKKKKYCEKELETKNAAKTALDTKLEETNTNIQYRRSVATAAAAEVKKFDTKIRASKASIRKATQLRKKSLEIFEKGSKNRHLAIKILRQAMSHLSTYYSKAGVATDRQKVVFDTINSALTDIRSEEKQAAAAEAVQVKDFEKLQGDARDEYDAFMKEMTTVKASAAKNVVLLAEEKEKKDNIVTDREAVQDQLKGLRQECNGLLKNFDDNTKARNFQVSQLRDVKDILAGSSTAARTG